MDWNCAVSQDKDAHISRVSGGPSRISGAPTPAHAATPSNQLTLTSVRDVTVTIPSTVGDAKRLLHFVRSNRDICEIEKNLARKRLHSTIMLLQILREEFEKAADKLSAADDDVGMVRAAIRSTGLRVMFEVDHDCQYCQELPGSLEVP
ncbi:hypothetical protein C8J57DRAFT_1492869 [Mycena rebaudengoi]|nr:hypothetical protein C8J57DRAFT_1492869 [Mycena rebaudengoi]